MDGKKLKKRENFDIKPHKFDLGILAYQSYSHLDMHLLNKIAELKKSEYLDLYKYHRDHYIENYKQKGASEEEFFREIIDLVEEGIKTEKQKNPLKLSRSKKIKRDTRIRSFNSFLEVLESRDQWGIFGNKDDEIGNLKEKNLKLEAELKKLKEIEESLEEENEQLKNKVLEEEIEIVDLKKELREKRIFNSKKIAIRENDFHTFMNIILALENLKDPNLKNDRRSKGLFFNTKSKNTWVKLVCNNFSIDKKKIEYSRVENYLVKERVVSEKSRNVSIEFVKEE